MTTPCTHWVEGKVFRTDTPCPYCCIEALEEGNALLRRHLQKLQDQITFRNYVILSMVLAVILGGIRTLL